MSGSEEKLLKWIGLLSGAPADVDRLGGAMFAGSAWGRLHAYRSTLNNDGSPLQVCITYCSSGRHIRIIGDLLSSLDEAGRVLSDVFVLCRSHSLNSIYRHMLSHTLPVNEQQDHLQGGLFWLAAGLEGGTALYANTRWGLAADRWNDAVDWLEFILPDPHPSNRIIQTLRKHAVLASLGLEGRTPADARAKLYWRLLAPTSFAQMHVPFLDHEAFANFLDLLASQQSVPLSGVVFSVGFSLSNGALCDAKIDLCAHCLPKPPKLWVQLLDECCKNHRLHRLDIGEGILSRQCDVAVVGFGVDSRCDPRLNVYLKAPSTDL